MSKKLKRPSSASATIRKLKVNEQQQQHIQQHTQQQHSTHIPQHYASTEDDDFFASCRVLSRDDLLVALHASKKKQSSSDVVISQLKVDNQRLDNELLKQQRRIDRLLESMSGGKGNVHGAEIRKEIEKSMLVRQLKQQIVILRNNIVEKETELETQRKSMKSSKLMELLCENHEYSLEINRLRDIIKQNQYSSHEIKKEKKHRPKNEIDTINSATLMMSKTVAGTSGPDIKRPNTATSSPNQLGRLVRPVSASATSNTGNVNRSLVQEMLQQSNSNEKTNSLSGPSLAELASRQILTSTATTINPAVSKTEVVGKPENLPVEESAVIPKTNTNTNTNTVTITNALFKVGEGVQGRFRGGGEWYNAMIKNVLEDNSYHIVYDDGDEETGVSEDKIRKKEITKDVKVNVTNTNTSTNTNRSNTPVSITGKFKVGDMIEAQYYNGTTWYEGKIAGLTSDGDFVKYDIIYSDGDREKAVGEDKIRSILGTTTITAPKVPAISLAMPDITTTTTTSSNVNTNDNKNNTINIHENTNDNDDVGLDDLSDDEGLSSGRGIFGANDDDGGSIGGDGNNYDEDFDA